MTRPQNPEPSPAEPPPPRANIELNPALTALSISGRVLHELWQHALETEPEECCGLVAGSAEERFLGVYRCRNEMTLRHRQDPGSYPRDGCEAYHMCESDLLRATADAERRGWSVTAVYHSHVGAGAYFSELDQHFAESELFPFPRAAQIVVAVWEHRVSQVGIFERDAVGGGYTGHPVEASAE